jgi:hypothetical protein
MSKRQPIDDILAEWDSFERPDDSARYQHYKGGEYTIIATGFLEDTETPCVAYRSLEKNIIWVRTAKNFLEKVEHRGKTTPRFTKIQE